MAQKEKLLGKGKKPGVWLIKSIVVDLNSLWE